MDAVRQARRAEVPQLARLWHAGWLDAHERLLPDKLVRHRTLDSLLQRMDQELSNLRVIGPVGEPLGFVLVKGDELNQLYVAPAARGTGVAVGLAADAERRVGAAGYDRIWLACAIGNQRAARFYERAGWTNVGSRPHPQTTPEGVVEFDVWRFEKALS